MGGVGIKPTGEDGEHSVLFNDLIRVKRRSIFRVSGFSFPYLRSVQPHLGIEVAGSRRPVLCPALSMRVPAYEYGRIGCISGTSKLSTGCHGTSAFFTRLTPACHCVDPVLVKGQPRDERKPWWRAFYFTQVSHELHCF